MQTGQNFYDVGKRCPEHGTAGTLQKRWNDQHHRPEWRMVCVGSDCAFSQVYFRKDREQAKRLWNVAISLSK